MPIVCLEILLIYSVHSTNRLLYDDVCSFQISPLTVQAVNLIVLKLTVLVFIG